MNSVYLVLPEYHSPAQGRPERTETTMCRVLFPGSGSSYLYFNARPLVPEAEPVVVTWNNIFKHCVVVDVSDWLGFGFMLRNDDEQQKISVNVNNVKLERLAGKVTLWPIQHWQRWVGVTRVTFLWVAVEEFQVIAPDIYYCLCRSDLFIDVVCNIQLINSACLELVSLCSAFLPY